MSTERHQSKPTRAVEARLERRRFLWEVGGGLGGVALAAMLADDGLLGAEASSRGEDRLAGRSPHFAPRAKSVIQIFLAGAASQVDTFDYKPLLVERAGKPFDETGKVELFGGKPGVCQPSYWPFRQHGDCARWVSDLLPKLAGCVDKMAFIHSMVSKSAIHGPAMFMMNSGFLQPGFPSMGAWVTYGLGSETRDLPAFVVLPDPRGVPPGGPTTWGAGFLPAVHQGTPFYLRGNGPPIDNLQPPADARVEPAGEQSAREFLGSLNALHLAARGSNTDLEARIASYELAARLQLSAPEATALADETSHTQRMYGLEDEVIAPFGRQCLLARRLVERGVRFVQVWCGADNTSPPRANWDGHEDIPENHGLHGRILDHAASGLLLDLEARGLLEETLVICTSEFGRMGCRQADGKGRDHNPFAFTTWLAGGGIRGGTSYGESDEFSFKVARAPVYSYDLHATALHLLGLDHKRLTYYHNGIERRLTDVQGNVIGELLATRDARPGDS